MKNFNAWGLARAPSRLAVLALFFTLALAFCGSSVVTEAPGVLPKTALESATAQPLLVRRLDSALAGASVPAFRRGAVVVDLTSGETLFSRNAQAGLAPASNEKLPVAFAALTLLEPQYRIATEALGEGEQNGTEWVGDIVLKGYGDPHLSTADLKTLALRLRALGIRSISGDLLGDESYFDRRRTAPGWKSSFLIRECAPLSALSVDRGHNTSASPPLIAARAFAAALETAGVSLEGSVGLGTASDYASILATVNSPALWKLIRFMDQESDNYTAELLLKQIGAYVNERGTTANGAAEVRTALSDAGIPLARVRIVDGSGLSLLNRLTPAALAELLTVVWSDPSLRQPFVSSLAVAGRNGTLEHRLRRRPAFGNVRAKTGTTNRASALSGYVRSRYAFVILQNGNPISSTRTREAQDRFVTLLAAQ
jgi:D-alanyl-D-alanine carboxypeptidase/D-alanyl-D-alanine-endopeptidase (penicillin-binding protein 4)